MKEILLKLKAGQDLSDDDIQSAFDTILKAKTPPEIVGAFLMGLASKGESPTEIAAAASYLREHATTLKAPNNAVDCCGTGGDVSGTYNISTAVALVCAACGVPVAKHGNRAASSKSGAADVLEEMGANIDVPKEMLESTLKKFNFAFLMAPKHHQVLKPLGPIRKNLGIPTIFNLLGPLANPAGTQIQLIGVFDKKWCRPMAEALKILGTKRAWVVHGEDGLDEITLTDKTFIAALNEDGSIEEFHIAPEDYGLQRCKPEELKGGDAKENAAALKSVLKGEDCAYRNIVLLNAAAVLLLAGSASSMEDGLKQATTAINSNAAITNFEGYKSFIKGFT